MHQIVYEIVNLIPISFLVDPLLMALCDQQGTLSSATYFYQLIKTLLETTGCNMCLFIEGNEVTE